MRQGRGLLKVHLRKVSGMEVAQQLYVALSVGGDLKMSSGSHGSPDPEWDEVGSLASNAAHTKSCTASSLSASS